MENFILRSRKCKIIICNFIEKGFYLFKCSGGASIEKKLNKLFRFVAFFVGFSLGWAEFNWQAFFDGNFVQISFENF